MGKIKRIILILVLTAALAGIVFFASFSLIKGMVMDYQYYRFPLRYEEHIKKYSQEFELDPYLVAAVIYEESRFRSDSNSHKGAIGLMQILPETGKYIAEKLGDEEYSELKLLESETNIRYGCYYLRYLKDQYDSIEKVLAAYNAGEGNVNEWIEGDSIDIKYQETTNFVNRVKSSKGQYERLYFESGRL